MKKAVTFTLFLFIAATAGAQVWEWSNPKPTGSNLEGIYFLDGSTGFISGDNGTILKTTDGGATWTCQNSGINSILYDIHFVDQNTGYAVGPSVILKTTNGGNTWTQLPPYPGLFIDTDFPTADIGFVISNSYGGNVSLSKTIDGGATWHPLTIGNFDNLLSLCFINQNIGFIGGQDGSLNGIMQRTADGGITWHDCWHSTSWGAIMGFAFTDSNKGFAVGAPGKLFRTTDSGMTWTPVTVPTNVSLNSITFPDAQNGYICCDYGGVMKSVDGGLTWTIKTVGSNMNTYMNICYPNPSTGFIMGWKSVPDNGVAITSTNGGTTYESLITGTRQKLMDIAFPDALHGYAAGDSGTIVRTVDAGGSWETVVSGTQLPLTSISFPNSSTGYAAGLQGTILKTNDGGTTWQAQTSGTNVGLNDIAFENSQTGWAVGDWGTILSTGNGGATWNPQVSGTSQYLHSISVVDAGRAWVVGTNGTILKTVDGGTTWIPVPNPGAPNTLYSVSFPDELTGFVVGSGGLFMRTSDGGVTWVLQWLTEGQHLRSIFFMDPLNGYTVGQDGYILQTIDGGVTWWSQRSGTNNNLQSVCIRGYKGFAAGDMGTILKTTGIGVGFQANDDMETIGIWPNPAGSTITIDLSDYRGKPCTVEISGIHGNGVFRTVSSEKNLKLDVGGFPAGMYLVKTNGNGKLSIGKFVKL